MEPIQHEADVEGTNAPAIGKDTVLLLDAYNLLYRAFASLPLEIVDTQGRSVNAIYGLVASILAYTREYQPSHIVAAFDCPAIPTFRQELYPDYQAHRGPLGGENAAEFSRQIETARAALPRTGIPTPMAPGFEADDIMGTLALSTARSGGLATVVSTDRDLLQVVQPNVRIVIPGKTPRIVADAASVRERIGVIPEHVPSFKALAGDASDNIPGIRGIGPKTAALLMENYGTLEAIYAHLPELPRRHMTALRGTRDTAVLFRRIATIRTNVPLDLEPGNFPALQLHSEDKVRPILAKMGL